MKRFLFSVLCLAYGASAWADLALRIEDACQKGEEWSLKSPEKSPALAAAIGEYGKYLHGEPLTSSAAKVAKDAKVGFVGEFWLARQAFDAGHPGFAADRFEKIFTGSERKEVALAALDCLGSLQRRYPALKLSENARKRLPVYLGDADERLTENAAVLGLVPRLILGADKNDGSLIAAIDKAGGVAGTYARALLSLKAGKTGDAIESLRQLLKGHARKALAASQNDFRLLLGRLLYATGQYEDAADIFADAMESLGPGTLGYRKAQSDRAWALLKIGKLEKARQFASTLGEGETVLVTAIAQHELGQHQDALATLRGEAKKTASLAKWLLAYRPNNPAVVPHGFTNRDGSMHGVPDYVAREWMESSVFVSETTLIDLLNREETSLPKAFGEEWKAEVAAYLRDLPAQRAAHQQRLDHELVRTARRLAHQRQDIDDNLRLLEVEALNAESKRVLLGAAK